MCGIVGFAGSFDKSSAHQTITKMTCAVAHRGPDAEGIFVNESIALGHRRLSIIDLSETANQPMTDNSGRFTIVFNGEIYNFAEVKAKLEDYEFKTNSDTEVLLASYIKNGERCLDDLNGMFAFAVWDAHDKSLFVARDRLGKKPLYYYHNQEHFIFASELRAVLEAGCVPRSLDRAALDEFLQFYSIAAPRTLIKNLRMLMPGSFARFQKGVFKETKYWSLIPPDEALKVQTDYQAATRQVKNLLQAAVERRLVSDVSLGAFLSGGIDSSAVVALMASVTEKPVETFAVGFDEAKYDESEFAQIVASKFNTRHHTVRLTAKDFLDSLPAALRAMDFPTVDGVNTFVVAGATKRQGCTVALSGLGGDELFAGYPIFTQYQKVKKFGLYYRLPQKFKNFVGSAAAKFKNDHKAARRAQFLKLENQAFKNLYPIFRRSFSRREAAELTGAATVNGNLLGQSYSENELAQIDRLPIFSQVSIGELSSYTLSLLLRDTDQMSMAHQLEVRVPFLDYQLVEYVLSLPDSFKQPVYPKKLLVDALGDLLPRAIVDRKKMGFTFPWDIWLRTDLKEFCQAKIERLKTLRLFEASVLDDLWTDFLNNSPRVTWLKIWQLTVLADWLERNRIDV